MHPEMNMDSVAVTVKNDASEIVYIDRDPNWDDEILTIDGKPTMQIYPLNPGAKVVVGTKDGGDEMGVIFATSPDYDDGKSGFYQLAIGQDDSGTMGVKDGDPFGHPTVNYSLHDRKPMSMTMLFVDDDTLSLAVTVKNDSSYDIQIVGDPNWDDQVMTINGKRHEKPYDLKPGGSVVVGIAVDYNQMGVDFTTKDLDGGGSAGYNLEIGPNDAGNEDVTDSYPFGNPAVKYTLHDQKPLSMAMVFVDAG